MLEKIFCICFGFSLLYCFIYVFFFSSRRRHTRSKRDWSSDVCSSDLGISADNVLDYLEWIFFSYWCRCCIWPSVIDCDSVYRRTNYIIEPIACSWLVRSEERRVGKECGCWGVR